MVKQKKVGELERQVMFSFADSESRDVLVKAKTVGVFLRFYENIGPFCKILFLF